MARVVYSRVIGAGPGRRTTFTLSDGRTITVVGDRAMRNNNPGNIEEGRFTRIYGSIGTDGRFAAFPTREMGIRAQAGLLFGPNYRNLTLREAIAKYAPEFENNTAAYVARVSELSGVSPETVLSDVPAAQRVAVVNAMHEVEGNTAVQAYDAQGRQRYTIDRDNQPSYQTQPNAGGFDFNNPGGFSPPRPDNLTVAGPPGQFSVPQRAPVGPVQRGVLGPPSLPPDRQMPSGPVKYNSLPPDRPMPAALGRALQKAGISTSPPGRPVTRADKLTYGEYANTRSLAPAQPARGYYMRPGDPELSAPSNATPNLTRALQKNGVDMEKFARTEYGVSKAMRRAAPVRSTPTVSYRPDKVVSPTNDSRPVAPANTPSSPLAPARGMTPNLNRALEAAGLPTSPTSQAVKPVNDVSPALSDVSKTRVNPVTGDFQPGLNPMGAIQSAPAVSVVRTKNVTPVASTPLAPVNAPSQVLDPVETIMPTGPIRQRPKVVAPAVKQPRVRPAVPAIPPVQPVAMPAVSPLSQSAFDARYSGLKPGDIYNGAVGSALATGGNIVSRENSWGPTTVTNKYGVTTAMLGDKQAAYRPGFDFSGMSPKAKTMVGSLAGGALGSMIGGPVGGILGGMLGRTAASPSGGGMLGSLFGGLFGGSSSSRSSPSGGNAGSGSGGGGGPGSGGSNSAGSSRSGGGPNRSRSGGLY